MALTPEAKVKNAVRKVLDELGVYYFCPATGGFGRSGVGDFVGCVNGRFFMIECKAEGGIVTELQKRELRRVKLNGGISGTVKPSTMEKFKTFFTEIANG
jgi:hypothetical protein